MSQYQKQTTKEKSEVQLLEIILRQILTLCESKDKAVELDELFDVEKQISGQISK